MQRKIIDFLCNYFNVSSGDNLAPLPLSLHKTPKTSRINRWHWCFFRYFQCVAAFLTEKICWCLSKTETHNRTHTQLTSKLSNKLVWLFSSLSLKSHWNVLKQLLSVWLWNACAQRKFCGHQNCWTNNGWTIDGFPTTRCFCSIDLRLFLVDSHS